MRHHYINPIPDTLIDHDFRPISAQEITQLTMKNDDNVSDDDHIDCGEEEKAGWCR